jgi:unsaturated chondroitin disaccharide hydrolase
VYGFTIAYRYSQDPAYLGMAQNVSSCWIAQVTACCSRDWVPLWDFVIPASADTRDTSAAAVATCGLIELSWYVSGTDRSLYLAVAAAALDSLTSTYQGDPALTDAIVVNGTGTWPASCVAQPLVYGDYYVVEAALKWQATPLEWRQEALAYAVEHGIGRVGMGAGADKAAAFFAGHRARFPEQAHA